MIISYWQLCLLDSFNISNHSVKQLQNSNCPGFVQERVNFHQNPGRDTAGQADPTWPNRPGYSIPCAVMLGSGLGGDGRRELTHGSGACGDGCVWEWLCGFCCFVLCILLICIVFVTVPFVCCSVKLPFSQPTSSLPVSFYSPQHPSRGRGCNVVLLLPAAAKL